jgi:hypothetical protein
MDKSAYQDMNQHVTILGWLYIASSIVLAMIGLILFPIVAVGPLLSGDGEAFIFTTVLSTIMLVFMLLLAAPGIIAGFGLLKRKSWARVLAIVLGIFNLTNFPIGTAIGVYTLYVLLQSDAGDIFATPRLA